MSPKEKKYILLTIGLGKERDYFVENLSTLISSGLPILDSLDAIAQEQRSRRMKKMITAMKLDIESGTALWRTLASTGLFPKHVITLIRLGEESGKLTENLKVIAIEQEKERVFKSKLRSALLYPLFVLSLTVIVCIGITWFLLPKLALVFSQLNLPLPLITKAMIKVGIFLGQYGYYAVPVAIIITAGIFFLIFSFSKTKFIGQYLLFSSPILKELIREVEVAQFGYLLGTLLEAGLPITHALDSLSTITEFTQYQHFYIHLRDSVEDGNSLQKSFATFKHVNRLIPVPVQQLLIAGERSGALSEMLLKISKRLEAKADTSTKNLAVILEPTLLIIVWLGVVSIALAVILPIYSLIGDFDTNAL